MLKCECCESRKNLLDGVRLNPKHICVSKIIANQQGMTEQVCPQRLSLVRGVGSSDPKCLRLNREIGMDKI